GPVLRAAAPLTAATMISGCQPCESQVCTRIGAPHQPGGQNFGSCPARIRSFSARFIASGVTKAPLARASSATASCVCDCACDCVLLKQNEAFATLPLPPLEPAAARFAETIWRSASSSSILF